MSTAICFLAGESSVRSWRYVAPHVPPEREVIFHELLGRAEPPAGYSWQDEVEALARVLAADGPADIVGLSAGATLALAFVAAHPEHVASLALVEPAWSFLPLSPVETAYYARLEAVLQLPASAARDGFRRLIVREDVALPPLRSDLAAREKDRQANGQPSALRAMTEAMQRHVVEPSTFARFDGRVLIVIGGKSHLMWRAQARALAAAFPRSRVEIFEDRHHLDAPQKAETDRFARLLDWVWSAGPQPAVGQPGSTRDRPQR